MQSVHEYKEGESVGALIWTHKSNSAQSLIQARVGPDSVFHLCDLENDAMYTVG